jgi:hypothetical protein
MTMKAPSWLTIRTSSAWADVFRPLGDLRGDLVSRITFLSCTPAVRSRLATAGLWVFLSKRAPRCANECLPTRGVALAKFR